MGTRGLLGHIMGGKKKAMYNHFDSYPAGLGVELARFINSLTAEQLEEMKAMVEKLEWVNGRDEVPKEIQERYSAFKFADLGVGNQSAADWYCLLRNVQGAKGLPHILEGTLTHQIDSTDFEQDSLLCEWTYFVDWENKKVLIHSDSSDIDETCSFADLSPEWMQKLQNDEDEDEDEE